MKGEREGGGSWRAAVGEGKKKRKEEKEHGKKEKRKKKYGTLKTNSSQ